MKPIKIEYTYNMLEGGQALKISQNLNSINQLILQLMDQTSNCMDVLSGLQSQIDVFDVDGTLSTVDEINEAMNGLLGEDNESRMELIQETKQRFDQVDEYLDDISQKLSSYKTTLISIHNQIKSDPRAIGKNIREYGQSIQDPGSSNTLIDNLTDSELRKILYKDTMVYLAGTKPVDGDSDYLNSHCLWSMYKLNRMLLFAYGIKRNMIQISYGNGNFCLQNGVLRGGQAKIQMSSDNPFNSLSAQITEFNNSHSNGLFVFVYQGKLKKLYKALGLSKHSISNVAASLSSKLNAINGSAFIILDCGQASKYGCGRQELTNAIAEKMTIPALIWGSTKEPFSTSSAIAEKIGGQISYWLHYMLNYWKYSPHVTYKKIFDRIKLDKVTTIHSSAVNGFSEEFKFMSVGESKAEIAVIKKTLDNILIPSMAELQGLKDKVQGNVNAAVSAISAINQAFDINIHNLDVISEKARTEEEKEQERQENEKINTIEIPGDSTGSGDVVPVSNGDIYVSIINHPQDTFQRYSSRWNDICGRIVANTSQVDKFQPEQSGQTHSQLLERLGNQMKKVPENGLYMFVYTGHGGGNRTITFFENGETKKCKIEYIACGAGQLTDKELYNLLTTNLPLSARIFCIFECCYGGEMYGRNNGFTESTKLNGDSITDGIRETITYTDKWERNWYEYHYQNSYPFIYKNATVPITANPDNTGLAVVPADATSFTLDAIKDNDTEFPHFLPRPLAATDTSNAHPIYVNLPQDYFGGRQFLSFSASPKRDLGFSGENSLTTRIVKFLCSNDKDNFTYRDLYDNIWISTKVEYNGSNTFQTYVCTYTDENILNIQAFR